MYKACLAKAAKQPMALESVDPGLLGTEEVEIAVEHCGVCPENQTTPTRWPTS